MRRFAAVFSLKRENKIKASRHTPDSSLFTHSVPPPSSIPSTPQLSSGSDPAHSSASSSGSTSLSHHTPHDDEYHAPLRRSSTKRSWKAWLGGKKSKSGSLKVAQQNPNDWRPLSDWKPRPDLPPLPSGNRTTVQAKHMDDTDEATSLDSEDDSELLSERVPSIISSNSHSAVSPEQALHSFHIFVKNSLLPPLAPAPSPFVQHSLGPLFPRSCSTSKLLPRPRTMMSNMLKSHLLSRLDDPDLTLTSTDRQALMSFTSQPSPAVINTSNLSPFNEASPSHSTKIFTASPGLHRWVTRPCFEDRFACFVPSESGVVRLPISGSALAVAALEFSEAIDALAYPDFDTTPSQLLDAVLGAPFLEPASKLESEMLSPESKAAPVEAATSPSSNHSRGSTYITVPSPLRNEHSPTGTAPLDKVQSHPTSIPEPKPVQVIATTVKRAVRFVEDNEDDGVPLHILRMKKKREEKLKFLHKEQLKRVKQEEEERRQQEYDRVERERQRLAQEQEKKERDQRAYAEQVAATRIRREWQRAGALSTSLSAAHNPLAPSPSSTSLRDTERNRSRDSRRLSSKPPSEALSTPRREISDSAIMTVPRVHLHANDSSSSGSRPPSIGHSPFSSNNLSHSRPGSTYSTNTFSSAEDVRQSGGSRRSSFVAVAGTPNRPYSDRAPPNAMWSGSYFNFYGVPPVPSVPDSVQDMPLLPPSAPFMQTQRRSRNSSPGRSNSSGSLRGGSAESSTERVNNLRNQHRQNSLPSSDYPPSSGSSTHRSEFRPSNERHTSGDSRRLSAPLKQPGYPQPFISQSHPHFASHGRPPNTPLPSQQLSQTSPWTAMPSQSGRIPWAMPVSSYSHNDVSAAGQRRPSRNGTRRQTTIS